MSKIKNSGLEQYGAEPFEQQQFGTDGVEGVNMILRTRFANTICAQSFVPVYWLVFAVCVFTLENDNNKKKKRAEPSLYILSTTVLIDSAICRVIYVGQ